MWLRMSNLIQKGRENKAKLCHSPLATALHNADRVHINHHGLRRDSLPVALVRQAAQDFIEPGARARFQQELDAVAPLDSRQRRRSGTEDLDALRRSVQALEKKLRCSCGCGLDIYTCRTTDFTCTYSPALHKHVLGMLGTGKSAQEVIDAFVAQYGQTALMAPPRRGFNLLGYFVPGVVLLAATGLLIHLLNRWTRQARINAPVATNSFK